jgi:hypothetical protein
VEATEVDPRAAENTVSSGEVLTNSEDSAEGLVLDLDFTGLEVADWGFMDLEVITGLDITGLEDFQVRNKKKQEYCSKCLSCNSRSIFGHSTFQTEIVYFN